MTLGFCLTARVHVRCACAPLTILRVYFRRHIKQCCLGVVFHAERGLTSNGPPFWRGVGSPVDLVPLLVCSPRQAWILTLFTGDLSLVILQTLSYVDGCLSPRQRWRSLPFLNCSWQLQAGGGDLFRSCPSASLLTLPPPASAMPQPGFRPLLALPAPPSAVHHLLRRLFHLRVAGKRAPSLRAGGFAPPASLPLGRVRRGLASHGIVHRRAIPVQDHSSPLPAAHEQFNKWDIKQNTNQTRSVQPAYPAYFFFLPIYTRGDTRGRASRAHAAQPPQLPRARLRLAGARVLPPRHHPTTPCGTTRTCHFHARCISFPA